MKTPRRRFLHFAAAGIAVAAAPQIALSQTYPNRPVRLIVGFAPGGGTDILARLVGQWLTERLGQPFFVENRTGATGNIATEAVVNAPADGYTLLVTAMGGALNTSLFEKLNFVFDRDIAPVAGIMHVPNVIDVNPSVPVKTLPEFIAYTKANPGKLNMGSAGVGSIQHVGGELFKMMTGVEFVHVPYRGGAPAVADLIAGQLQVMFDVLPESIPHIRAGKLRPLAVTTATRSAELPQVPTVREFVAGYETDSWWGVGAPRNTPAEIIDKLNKEINAGLADPKLKGRIADLGGTVLPRSPEDFGILIARETERWGKVIRAANIKLE